MFFSFIDRPGKECSVSNLLMRVQGGTLPMISKVIPRCSQHRSGNSCDGVGATLWHSFRGGRSTGSSLFTLNVLTSVSIFSVLFTVHFLKAVEVINSFILVTLMFDSRVICPGEISCQSLLGVEELNLERGKERTLGTRLKPSLTS